MNNRDNFDQDLEERFGHLREADAHVTPNFEAMLAGAQARMQGNAAGQREPVRSARWRRLRVVAVAGPLLAAAGLGAVWFNPKRAAEREFDRVVGEWTATSQQAFRAPTDGLLAVPGSEYLRSVPAIGRGLGDFRRGS